MIDEIKRAIELTQDSKFKEAEELYNRLLKQEPNDGVLLSTAGLFYISIRNYDKAVDLLRKACNINETFGRVASLGFAEYERRNFQESAEILEHALSLGENIDVYNKLILSLFEIKNFKKAIYYTDEMSKLYPEHSKTISNQVKSLTHKGLLFEAEKLCVDYLKKNPTDSHLWYHLGLLKELIYSNEEQAIECYKISGQNGNPSADYNIAVSLKKIGKFKEAEDHFKQFLERYPGDPIATTSLGLCYLSQKKFNEGYELIYNRTTPLIKKLTKNLWKPNTPLDKELVIIGDQGYGDQIQFIRYLPFITKNHNIKVAVSESLIRLFKQNYPEIEFIHKKDINPNIQALRLTDLAYVLGMNFDNIPFSEGYLKSNSSNIKNNKLKIGLCWEAGASGIRDMIKRTINVKYFEPLLNLKNIQVYSFQYTDTQDGNIKYPQMINLTKDFKDFSDTASALSSMDVIITVDTSIVHLAGALGIKTYLLLPYSADWRWFNGAISESNNYETQTPWYKSVELFRQNDYISWTEPISNIIERLKSN